ncbi:MAG: hypothetical protein KDK70_31845, partial [Myxococcales bacterium]|nr:hypothetical protein [Myxococcales bacterium]
PGPDCAHLVSSDEVAPVTMRIVNAGTDTVHLVSPSTCGGHHIEVVDATGLWFPGPSCSPACEGSLLGECGCLANCPAPVTIALMPGGTYETSWEGWVAQVTEASEACAGECAGECSLRVPPATGPMQLLVGLATTLDCDENCTCTPNAQGWCELPGIYPSITEVNVEAIDWPTPCPTVELTVQ